MSDASFFTHPAHEWQRRYEALRASFIERLPAKDVAERFGYSEPYIYLLRHRFKHGLVDFSEPEAEGRRKRRRVTVEVRRKICTCRGKWLSAADITELLSKDGVELSVRTVERVLAEEGFPRLLRRKRHKVGLTVKGAEVPPRSKVISVRSLEGCTFSSDGAGVFLFAPLLVQLGIADVVRAAGLPGTKVIPAMSYFLSFLALKLLGTERYAHVGDNSFDPGLGLFTKLNALPKCTPLSDYSFGLDEVHLTRLQHAFIKSASRLDLYDGSFVNLDFHTVPHFGEESELEEHWVGTRGKSMKGALTLFAQDAETTLLLYTAADIRRSEANDQVTEFLSFWRKVRRGILPTFVFDARFTTYRKLSELNETGVKFITLRRRGKQLLAATAKISDWQRIHIPNTKRKYANPLVHESSVKLKDYDGKVRQVIVKGHGREKPTFMVSNDFDLTVELLVGSYGRRWRVEKGIAEVVKFFNLNALSSPILVKVYFDVIMTLIADTLYTMLAQKLRGFEHCTAPKLFRNFVKGQGLVAMKDGQITVTFPRRAHNPILRGVPWSDLPSEIPWLDDAKLNLRFR
jgi:transposase